MVRAAVEVAAAAIPAQLNVVPRARKSHRKSRHGCGNCKLRRVKCDEAKPKCQKCMAYGVTCSYDPGVSDMQPSVDGVFNIDLNAALPPRTLLAPPVLLPVAGSPSSALYQMTPADRILVEKFQTRAVLTMGTTTHSKIFQSRTLGIAFVVAIATRHLIVVTTIIATVADSCRTPSSCNIVLALTLIHDGHLTQHLDRKRTAALAFHWYHGTALFNAKLSRPVEPSESDALWAAATLLSAAAMADVRARTPDEAWPLAPPSPLDLAWLRMSDGKRVVRTIARPLRSDGLFAGLSADLGRMVRPTPRVGAEVANLPPAFVELLGLDDASTPETNPYHGAATILAQTMPFECNRDTVLMFLSFVSAIDPGYKALLERRDPRALLLLAYWYAKVFTYSQWWIWRRAVVEGPAICLDLERRHAAEDSLLELLDFPKRVFGMRGRAESQAARP